MQIVRAFIKLRAPTTSEELERKIPDLEAKYNKQFRLIFQATRKLIHQEQLDKNKTEIGYKIEKKK